MDAMQNLMADFSRYEISKRESKANSRNEKASKETQQG
jgi:hypothetical protein